MQHLFLAIVMGERSLRLRRTRSPSQFFLDRYRLDSNLYEHSIQRGEMMKWHATELGFLKFSVQAAGLVAPLTEGGSEELDTDCYALIAGLDCNLLSVLHVKLCDMIWRNYL